MTRNKIIVTSLATLFFILVFAMSAAATTCSVSSSASVPVLSDEDITVSCSDIGTGYTVTITPSGYTSSCITVSPSSTQVTSTSPSATFTTTGVSMACAGNVAGRTVTWTFSHSGGNSIASKTTVYNVIPPITVVPSFDKVTYNATNGTAQNLTITLALTTSQAEVDIRNIAVEISTDLENVSGITNQTSITIDVSESQTQYVSWTLEMPPMPPGSIYDFNVSITADNANSASAATTVNITSVDGGYLVEIGLTSVGSGWNLISLPVTMDTVAIANVTSSIEGNFNAIYGWNAQTQQYVGYDPQNPGFSALQNMTPDQGYFIKMDTTDTLSVTGTIPSSTNINLVQGWNLIGYPSETETPVGTALTSIDGNYEAVYAWDASLGNYVGYDPGNPGFSTLKNMTAGKGYFIKLTAASDTVTIS